MERTFGLVNGHIRYCTHKLTYNGRTEYFFDAATCGNRTEWLERNNISYTLKELALPDEATIKKHAEPAFGSFAEAQRWLDKGCPKDDIEIIKETLDTLIISMIGGE